MLGNAQAPFISVELRQPYLLIADGVIHRLPGIERGAVRIANADRNRILRLVDR